MKKVNQIGMAITVIVIAATAMTMSCSKEKVKDEKSTSASAQSISETVSNMNAAYKKAQAYNDSLIMCHGDSTKMNMMTHHDNMYHQYDSVYSQNHAMCKQQMDSMMSGGNMNGMMGNGNSGGMMGGNSSKSNMMNGQMMDMKICDAKMDSLHHSHTQYHPQNAGN